MDWFGASIAAAALSPQFRARRYYLALIVGALLANAPDLDFLLVFALRSKAWHRGFTHSLVFALICCGLLLTLSRGRRRSTRSLAYGLAFASHGVLDFLTTKEGGGVELLWPLSTQRFLFGWHGLSELPSRVPVAEILKYALVELAVFAPLLVTILLLRGLFAPHMPPEADAS